MEAQQTNSNMRNMRQKEEYEKPNLKKKISFVHQLTMAIFVLLDNLSYSKYNEKENVEANAFRLNIDISVPLKKKLTIWEKCSI